MMTSHDTAFDTRMDPIPGFGTLESFGVTDIGRARSTNEDHFVVADLGRSTLVARSSVPPSELPPFAETHRELMLVADGVGGHVGGELASRLVAEELVGYLADTIPFGLAVGGRCDVERRIRTAIEHCQAMVDRQAESNPELSRMGTTVTMGYLAQPHMVVGHVGDSRCYLLRRGVLEQLTRDHTVAQEKIDAGDAPTSADGNRLTSAIAGGLLGVTPDVFTVDLEPEDTVLLCTDGLTDELSDDEIRDVLDMGWSAELACRLLIQAAKRAGGRDNITCVVTRLPLSGWF